MGQEPTGTITYQDPSMQIVVSMVFPNTRHMFCMWHIMTKVSEKVGPGLSKDLTFKQTLNGLVWNDNLDLEVFEHGWLELMVEYDLNDHIWFKTLFETRQHWVLAYFTDVFTWGLVWITSWFEGENNFFEDLYETPLYLG